MEGDKRHDLYIYEIRDGEFKDGELNGYGRVINRHGIVTIGYFKHGQPYGSIIEYINNEV